MGTVTDSWGRALEPPTEEEVELLRYIRGLARPSPSFPGQSVLPLDLTDPKQRRFFHDRFAQAPEMGRFFPAKKHVIDATAVWQAKHGVPVGADVIHKPVVRHRDLPRFAGWHPEDGKGNGGADEVHASAWQPALFLSAFNYEMGMPEMGSAGVAAVLTVPGESQVKELVLEMYDRTSWRPVAATSSGPRGDANVSLSAEGALASPGDPVAAFATGYYVPQGKRFAIPVVVTADLDPPAYGGEVAPTASQVSPTVSPARMDAVAGDAAASTVFRAAPAEVDAERLSITGAAVAPRLTVTVTDPVNKVTPRGQPVRVAINRTNVLNDCDYYYIEPSVGGTPSEIAMAVSGAATAEQGSRFDAATATNLNGSLILVNRGGGSPGGATMVYPSWQIPAAVQVSTALMTWSLNPAQFARTPPWQSGNLVDVYFTLNFAMNGAGQRPNTSLTVTSDTNVQTTLPNVALVPPMQFVWGCVAAGERVRMADGTQRPIEDVRIGERVAGPGRRALRVADLTRGWEPRPLLRIAAGDVSLRVTAGHPVRTAGGWVLAREIAPGDLVETEAGLRAVTSVDSTERGGEVRNLVLAGGDAGEVDVEAAAFYAGGILVGDNRMQAHANRLADARAAAAASALPDDWRHDLENHRRIAAGLAPVPTGDVA